MADEKMRKPRSRKWLYAAMAGLVLLGIVFVAGTWVANRGERAVAGVTESYVAAYAGLDTPKDVPALMPLYAADAVLRDAARDRTYAGASEIEDALNALLTTPDFDLNIDRTSVGDDSALVIWTANGKRSDSGRVTQVSGITLLEVSKGTITRETWYYDPAKAPF